MGKALALGGSISFDLVTSSHKLRGQCRLELRAAPWVSGNATAGSGASVDGRPSKDAAFVQIQAVG